MNKVISYSQELSVDKLKYTKNLIKDWKRNKYNLCPSLFDDYDLIYEHPTPVTFHLSEKEKQNKFNEFLDLIINKFKNEDLACFLKEEVDGFWDNITTVPYQVNESIEIPVGMKIVKAFKFFEEDQVFLYSLQTKASMLIQENNITGKFCISVHPLDFLSSSENNHNWRSCHSLDGEYKAGNLSYIGDGSTLICYLKSDKDAHLPRFPYDVPWNDKKWRMLIFLSNDRGVCMAGRQYPFFSADALDFLIENIFPKIKFGAYSWSLWHNDYIHNFTFNSSGETQWLDDKYYPINHSLVKLHDLVEDNEDRLHYNDLLSSTVYTPYYSVNSLNASYHPKIYVGSSVRCLVCGDNYLDDSESFVCYNCREDHYGSCCNCGETLYDDDFRVWINDDLLCESCYCEHCGVCEECQEAYYLDDLIWIEEEDIQLCTNCAERRKEKNG